MPSLHSSRGIRAVLAGAIAVCAGIAEAQPAASQASLPAGSTFTIFLRAIAVGTEQITVRRTPTGWTIAGVLEQVPTMNEDGRSIPCPVAHVLELNAGWVRSHGVRPGQRVRIEN